MKKRAEKGNERAGFVPIDEEKSKERERKQPIRAHAPRNTQRTGKKNPYEHY
ncbi:hypothetical protein [Cytobacillus oceanisediminis]|uniref:hypothetical protein n=1 Tax=Cytobacillus oceanisediminis TaxID=665099 RepID=UPI003736947D